MVFSLPGLSQWQSRAEVGVADRRTTDSSHAIRRVLDGKYEVTQTECIGVREPTIRFSRTCRGYGGISKLVFGPTTVTCLPFKRGGRASASGYSYRLPTEAEWDMLLGPGERPVRIGDGTSFSLTQANLMGPFPTEEGLRPIHQPNVVVGSYTPNGLGSLRHAWKCVGMVSGLVWPYPGARYKSQGPATGPRACSAEAASPARSGLPIRQARQPRAKLPPSHPGFSRGPGLDP